MICAHGRVFSNNNNNKMSSRFVIEGQRAEDPNDDFDVEKSNEMSVALDARKGKRVEYYQDGTGNNNNKNSAKNAHYRNVFGWRSWCAAHYTAILLLTLGVLLGVLLHFTYTVYARDNDMVQKHVQAHKDAWQAYKKTYREYGYSNSNDMIGAVEEEMLKTQETKVEEALRRGEEGIAVVDEEATVIMHNETITPTSPPPPQFDYESECKLAESFGNRFQEYDLREFLPSEEEGYPQMAATGWEPYRWRDDETYISTWTSLNARGIVNKVLSNVTLDEKRACVPAEPERLAIDVAIIHFRCADVPFNDELSYPLAPPEYSVFVGKKLKELDVKRIIPVMCSVHKVEESIVEERKRLCTELFDAQLDIIKREFTEEVSINAISCLSDIETLFLVRDAAAVAQLIPSSFTFIAGLARSDAKSFITPHYGLKEAKAIQILSPLEEEKHRVRLKNMADNLPWTMFCPGCGEGQDVLYPDGDDFIGWNYSYARDRLMQFHKEMITEKNNHE